MQLIKDKPRGYEPWLFPCKPNGKDPDVNKSWKSKTAQLTYAEALQRLQKGGNVGISGRKNDPLILVDIDDPQIGDVLKPTLKVRSRSRLGTHGIYYADDSCEHLPMNIPTEHGEVRSSDQYVVAPGSYVPITDEQLNAKIVAGEITEEQAETVKNDPDRGLYTVENQRTVSRIKFGELPEIFQEQVRKADEARQEIGEKRREFNPETIEGTGNHSALFDLTIRDVCPRGHEEREGHPLHISDTDANWLINGDLGHCWRHGVSLNAIQYLVVEAGYATCIEAGSEHSSGTRAQKNAAGPSCIIGDDEAIWVAWRHAKQRGYIPDDDPIPVRALHHIARKHKVAPETKIPLENGKLPYRAYYRTIEIVEEEY